MTLPRLLDLFCGAGGAAMGYHRAGFDDIVGVDIVPQPNYPFTFILGDALQPPVRLEDFDLIHASPPCQAYSVARLRQDHPQLVEPTRQLLAGYPHVIENVMGAGLAGHLVLCGSMFGLEIQRHRSFELSSGWPLVMTEGCNHLSWKIGAPWLVAGHGSGMNKGSKGGTDRSHNNYRNLAHAKELMGMPWAQTIREVTEAIPPAYTEYLGRQFLDQLDTV